MTNPDQVQSVEYSASAAERYQLTGAEVDVRACSAPSHGANAIVDPITRQLRLREPAERGGGKHAPPALRGDDYPVLRAIWDNDDDAVYDSV